MSDEVETRITPSEGEQQTNADRTRLPKSAEFARYIGAHWAADERPLPPVSALARAAAGRRAALSVQFPKRRIVVEAGDMKQRSNDTDYPYRAHSAFSWLTAWGADSEPGAVLVLEPADGAHEAVLHFPPSAGRDSDEFYANSAIGEFWVGPRPGLDAVGAELGLRTAPLSGFAPADGDLTLDDPQLARALSEARLVKDADEVAEMRAAIAATANGFDDIVANLPRAIAADRGERVVEGVFFARARLEGNDLGYGTIAASGPHACVLHWTRNDGPVAPGDLVLVDAGVEMPSLYTADITRTLPVTGRFTEVQRRVYETVREAADAAFAIVKPGIVFREVHAAAMAVIAQRTREWGLPLVDEAELAELDGQAHRRYMVHATSHHLGLDVHDCAQARRDMYIDGVVREGMVFTIEPGLYFQPDDLTVPEEYRGIGIRIEDDVLVTAHGVENLSAAIPRTADDVEAWIAAGGHRP